MTLRTVCECGRRIDYPKREVGDAITCECGRTLTLPPAAEISKCKECGNPMFERMEWRGRSICPACHAAALLLESKKREKTPESSAKVSASTAMIALGISMILLAGMLMVILFGSMPLGLFIGCCIGGAVGAVLLGCGILAKVIAVGAREAAAGDELKA